jgi:2-polyprenyl-3-methyl-5-hydroxy-6-metoxy-1,4-benzoquinol methylase
MQNILTLEEHNEQYRILHKEARFRGYSLSKHISELTNLIINSNIRSVLDFGCGKAECWSVYNLNKLWDIDKFALYDPGVEKFSVLPDKAYDLTICIDVLEHIPENLLDEVLEQMMSRTNKILYCTISTRLANKKLPNRNNAHATVKPAEWWIQKFGKYKNRLIMYRFD